MKAISNRLLTNLITANLAYSMAPRSRLNRKMWNPTRTRNFTRTARRRRRIGFNRPLEVNRAVGGNKSLRFNGPKLSQVINFYTQIRFNPMDGDKYQFVVDGDYTDNYDLKAQLNDSDEFLTLRKQAIQYNIRQIAISFNYNRVPSAKEKWAKIVLTPEADKIERTDYLYNANGMAWDMTTNGTKNYNFRINRANTEDDDAGWIIGQAQFNGILKIWIDGQGDNYVPPQQYTFDKEMVLGDVKISVQIEYYHKDITDTNAKIIRTKFTTRELLQPLLEKRLEEEQLKNILDVD